MVLARFGLDLVHAETEPALRQFAAETSSEEIPDATNVNFDVHWETRLT